LTVQFTTLCYAANVDSMTRTVESAAGLRSETDVDDDESLLDAIWCWSPGICCLA